MHLEPFHFHFFTFIYSCSRNVICRYFFNLVRFEKFKYNYGAGDLKLCGVCGLFKKKMIFRILFLG